MRPGAKIRKFPLAVKADRLALTRMFLNQLHLIRLALFFHFGLRFVRGQRKPLQGQVFLDNLLDFRLNFRQILRGQRPVKIKVIIKPVLNRGANRQLGLGEQPLDRLRHHMRSRMPIRMFALRLLKRKDLQFPVLLQRGAQIHGFPLPAAGTGRLVQPGANGFGHICHRAPFGEFPHVPFQCNLDLFHQTPTPFRILSTKPASLRQIKKPCPKIRGKAIRSRFHPKFSREILSLPFCGG